MSIYVTILLQHHIGKRKINYYSFIIMIISGYFADLDFTLNGK